MFDDGLPQPAMPRSSSVAARSIRDSQSWMKANICGAAAEVCGVRPPGTMKASTRGTAFPRCGDSCRTNPAAVGVASRSGPPAEARVEFSEDLQDGKPHVQDALGGDGD